MSNFMASSLNGKFPRLSTDKLEVMSLLINNACNLSCRHCYLQASRFDRYLAHEEWMKFLRSVFADIAPSVVCFAGKEPFLNRKSVNIMLDAIKLRNDLQPAIPTTEIGVITNGTLLDQYRQDLLEVHPDYIDVSIDGMPEIHDQVRGSGAFEMLRPNLLWLLEHFPGNVWLSHTLLSPGKNTLPEFIDFYHTQFGINKFAVGVYIDLWYTDQNLKLTRTHYQEMIDHTLPRLETLSLNAPVEIIIEFGSNQGDLIDIFAANGWANPVDPISSVAHEFDNGLTVRLNTTRIPVGLWRSVRVTPEGFWMAAEDILNVKAYDKFAVAKLRDYDYNARELYLAGLNSSRFTTFMRDFSIYSNILLDLPVTAKPAFLS